MHRVVFLFSAALAALACQARGAKSPAAPAVIGATRMVTFRGMCDASAAVSMGPQRFAVADDEDNVLRIYDAERAGPPLAAVDVSHGLNLRKKIKKWVTKTPEIDLEAGALLSGRAYWITSHGRSSSGKLRPERFRFFATTVPEADHPIQLIGRPYEALMADLVEAPELRRFELRRAARHAPKSAGGLNIEGLTATPDGHLLIGFRNPVPEGHALLVPLLNPEQVVSEPTAKARLGEPILLDLGGLGVRSLAYWRGRYLIAAGHFDKGAPSRLYVWSGDSPPRVAPGIEFPAFNPEAFVAHDERPEVLLLSDDGEFNVERTPCKELTDPKRKYFRGAWVKLAGNDAGSGASTP